MKDEQDWRAQVILALFARAKCVVWLGLSRKHAPAPNDHYVRALNHKGQVLALACVLCVMMAIGIVPRVGSAASVTAFSTLTVTKTADTNDGVCDADCSLREAIEAASSTDNDEIRFAAGVTGTITLNNELVIDKSLAIIGPGANTLTVSGNNVPGASNGVQVFRIHSFHSVEISGLTIANGFASDEAGGILSYGQVNIAKCTISGNSARIGGGILNYGNMIIINSIISDNSASDFGGGIFNFGTLSVINSTINNNTVENSNGGGGLCTFLDTLMNILNSTISGNKIGGGILVGGKANIINSTISGNYTSGSLGFAGGVWVTEDPGSGVSIKNSIIAKNSNQTLFPRPDVSGLFTTLGYNLIGDSTGSTGFINSHNNDKVGSADSPLDPMLGPLQSNGGPTPTMALLPGSSAIDAGAAFTDPFGNQLITTDQRGAARPRDFTQIPNPPGGNGSDIGAFERQPTSCFGCGPGLWKVKLNHWAVTGYSPDQPLGDVFAVARTDRSLAPMTLLEALDGGGGRGLDGGVRILMRAAVAALLNASHPDVVQQCPDARDANSLIQDAAGVIADVDAALQTNDREVLLRLATAFQATNNLQCPLEGRRD